MWQNDIRLLLSNGVSTVAQQYFKGDIACMEKLLPQPLPIDGVIRDFTLIPEKYRTIAETGKNLTQEIEECLKEAWLLFPPSEKQRVTTSLKWIVPVFGIKGVAETSMSMIDLPYIAFLSPKSSIETLEALVHEAGHLELFMYELLLNRSGEWSLQSRIDYGGSFFSPWRNEIRPAIGVLHAAFVFLRIVNVLAIVRQRDFVNSNELTTRIVDHLKHVSSVVDFLKKAFIDSPFYDLVLSIDRNHSQKRQEFCK